MAFSIAPHVEAPKYTVLSKYEVYRIGQFPTAMATFTECVYELDGPAIVQSATDSNSDGLKDTLVIPGLASVTSLVGRKLCYADSTEIGKIATAVVSESSPGVNTVTITLVVAPTVDLTGVKVGACKVMAVGTPVYRRAVGGKEWSIYLDGTKGVAMTRMIQMLGAIYFVAAKTVLVALGVSKTDGEIVAALDALAATQTNIDGIFAAQGENLELERRLGTLHPDIIVTGDAPVV